MPAVSRQQQKYLYWKFGDTWVKAHHFDTIGAGTAHARPDDKAPVVKRKKRG